MNFIYDINIATFILLNILTILIVGVLYFVVKEIYRIRGGQLGGLGVTAVGSLLGIFLMIGFIVVKMNINLGYVGPGGDVLYPQNVYNQIVLAPSIIIIIIFVIMIDRRLVFPLFFFQTISFIILFYNLPKPVTGSGTQALWTKMLFTIIEYLLLCIVLFFIPSIEFIKKNGIKLLVSFITYLLIYVILYILYFVSLSSSIESWFQSSEVGVLSSIFIGYSLLFIIIQVTIIWFIEKIYSNFNALETFSTQDDVSYYKMSLAQNRLVNLIDERKINIGLLVLFQIKDNDGSKTSLILEKLRVNTEDKYKNTFYFKVSASYYGAFFQLSDDFKLNISLENNKKEERTENDELYPITREISRISQSEDTTILATGSIYGIHSYSTSELIEYAKFLMSPVVTKANSNPLIIYDYQRVKERLKETIKVRNLPVDTESIRISFLRALSSEEIFYPSITYKNEEQTLIQVMEEVIMREEQIDVLLRHSAYQTLRKFQNLSESLIIYYSAIHLSSKEFKLSDFLKKTKNYINHDNLIIGLNTTTIKMNDTLLENINKLRENGIRIALVNPKTITQEENDAIQPDFILDPNTPTNPLKIKKINLKFNTNAILLNPNLIK